MSIPKHNNLTDIEDDRAFTCGEIWKIRDELVSLLPGDRVSGIRETFHRCRTVVILQNTDENSDPTYPIIRVAPLTSTVEFKTAFDILLEPSDGVNKECMLSVQLAQPILKKDLFECVGSISDDKLYEMLALESYIIGLDDMSDSSEEIASDTEPNTDLNT